MFEHLGPVPETTQKKRLFSRGYMVFLLIALMVYTVVDSSTSGPAVEASYQEIGSEAFVYGATRHNEVMVNYSHGIVFDFFIEVASPDISLSSVRFKINGDYDPDILSGISLYQDSVQLGSDAKLEDGYLYFDIGNYKFSQAKNYFYLLLENSEFIDVDDNFYFSIEDRDDLLLSHKDYNFSADGIYPISSQKVAIVESGRLIFVNKATNDNFYYLANREQELVNFSLSSDIERSYLHKITLDYKSDGDDFLGDVIFRLEQGDSFLAEASVDTDKKQIVFELEKFLAIKNNTPQEFSIKVNSLAEGMYDFNLSISSVGYFSGKDIGRKNIALDKIIVRENYPVIQQEPVSEKMKKGWNKLYAINIKTAKEGELTLKKLSWKIDSSNVDIKDIRLSLDGKKQEIASNFNSDELSVILLDDLIIDKNEQVLELLVNLGNVSDSSSVSSYLMADSFESANNIWAQRDVEYNSYFLPYLPLTPNILR